MVTDREVFATDGVQVLAAGEDTHTLSIKARTAMNANVLELRGTKYLCVWVFIVVLHCMCAVYLTLIAKVYWFITHPNFEYFAKLAAGVRYKYLRHAGVAFGLIGALHWWQLLNILWASFQANELVLPDGNSRSGNMSVTIKRKLSVRSLGSSRFSLASLSAQLKKLTLPPRLMFRTWRFLFSRHGIFGIESDVFKIVFTIRELVEIVSQSFQAQRSSELLSRPWLNNLFVALVVMNCWSTPILQHVFRHHQGMERIVCLLLDVVLNIGSSMLVPIVIFIPYYQAFIPEIWLFPIEDLYDGLWFTRLAMENQLLFSLSTADIFSKLIPHLGIYTSLASVATLIHRTGSRRKSKVLASNAPLSILPRPVPKASTSDSPRAYGPVATATRASRVKENVMHLFFFTWGLGLLILHLRAATRFHEAVMGCRQVTGSWFATDYPCSVYTYNCYREGTTSPDEDSWKHLDKQSLVWFGISHCPELNMPNRLQSFTNLLGLQIHNVTIVEWTKANGVSTSKHSKLVVILMSKVNMSGLPEGILGPLPQTLMDIELSHTNLTSLPPDLHERWHLMATLYFEHSLLTEFPANLLSLQAIEFSVNGNLIERVPKIPGDLYFLSLTLNSNPIKELPEISDGTTFTYVNAENTLLEKLPDWALGTATTPSAINGVLSISDTPYCKGKPGSAECLGRDDRPKGKVPLYVIDPLFPL